MTMEKFVLDTSVFTNPAVFVQFSADPHEAIGAFLELARSTPAEFYMPRSIYAEFCQMRDLGELAGEYEARVRIRSPRRFDLSIPGELLYEFINEVRLRIDRGLRIAEEHARMGYAERDEQDVGKVISRLRERYREALRRGIIDSREDADMLLLAYELDAVLVSADEGLRTWADKVGARLIDPANLRHLMIRLIEDQSSAE